MLNNGQTRKAAAPGARTARKPGDGRLRQNKPASRSSTVGEQKELAEMDAWAAGVAKKAALTIRAYNHRLDKVAAAAATTAAAATAATAAATAAAAAKAAAAVAAGATAAAAGTSASVEGVGGTAAVGEGVPTDGEGDFLEEEELDAAVVLMLG